VATADIAFRAWDPTLEGVFVAAAATMNVMVEELASIQPIIEKAIRLENPSLEMLLFDFLQELIYYKDAETLLLRVPTIQIAHKAPCYVLQAQGRGERLQAARHHTRADVKAITLHRFALHEVDDGWETLVILDI
jgi:SHS2 domain-containing protein